MILFEYLFEYVNFLFLDIGELKEKGFEILIFLNISEVVKDDLENRPYTKTH